MKTKKTARKTVGLYGGSFDPPHVGHVITTMAVLNSAAADEVWLVPTGRHRDKEHAASPDQRKAMLAIFLATQFGSRVPVRVDETQLNQPHRVSSTWELLQEMERRHPGIDFRIVIGSDLIHDIGGWAQAGQLIRRKGLFLVVPRLGRPLPARVPSFARVVLTPQIALTNISSSLIRSYIQGRKSLEGMMPPAVINHILRKGLYMKKPIAARSGRSTNDPVTLAEGRFLRLRSVRGWEFVERSNCTGVVVIVPVTDRGELVLVEQYRIPVGRRVIEFPAGLVNDEAAKSHESVETAAARELEEETGYRAARVRTVFGGPVSSGLTSEALKFVLATGLKKVGAGGGDANENIRVHVVPRDRVEQWLSRRASAGCAVDPKIYAGLYAADRAHAGKSV